MHGGNEVTSRQGTHARDDLGLDQEDERAYGRSVQEVDCLTPIQQIEVVAVVSYRVMWSAAPCFV